MGENQVGSTGGTGLPWEIRAELLTEADIKRIAKEKPKGQPNQMNEKGKDAIRRAGGNPDVLSNFPGQNLFRRFVFDMPVVGEATSGMNNLGQRGHFAIDNGRVTFVDLKGDNFFAESDPKHTANDLVQVLRAAGYTEGPVRVPDPTRDKIRIIT